MERRGNKVAWVKNLIDRLIAIQDTVLYDFPEEKRQAGYGRAAELIIDGPKGGIFELWFCREGVRPKPDNAPVKNTVYMTESTLLDLITPDKGLDDLIALIEKEGGIDKAVTQLYPRLDFRTAVANRLITISGDKPDVDSEEWARILETVMLKMAFPIVIRGMLRAKKGR